MTRGEKAAATRAANKAAREAEARKAEYQARALRAWDTRRANLRKKGLITPKGKASKKLVEIRHATALKVWESRRANAA